MEKGQELRGAARRGDEVRVQQLLAERVNVNATDGHRQTALHYAAQNGHTGTVQALLTAGATLDSRNSAEDTPLHLATYKGHTGTVQALLAAGADINAGDGDKRTPLHMAVDKGQPDCVRVLLKAGANTVIRDRNRKTAKKYAVHEDVLQVFQLFKGKTSGRQWSKHLNVDLQPKVVNGFLTIDLSDKGLASVPAEVFDFTDIEHLDLSHNRLTSIPEEIRQLQKLRKLDLSTNLLTQLPQVITTLLSLEYINVSGNKLETLPDGISSLLQLHKLHIHNNRFKEIPEEVCSLLQLNTITVSQNPLKCLPDTMYQLTGLRSMSMISCQFDEFPRQVLQLEGLQNLHMDDWAGKGKPSPVPEGIGTLTNLQFLYLRKGGLESLPDDVAELVQLTYLDISGNRFTSVPEQIMNLSNLYYLDLSGNRISRLPLTLSRLTKLEGMIISRNPLTYPPADVCEKGTAAIMDFLRMEVKNTEERELRKVFHRFSQSVSESSDVEDLGGALGLTADEMTNIQASKNKKPSSQASKVLSKWMEMDREASMDKLQQELSKAGMNQLAEKVSRIQSHPTKRLAPDTADGPPSKLSVVAGPSRESHLEAQQLKEKIRQAEQKPVQMQHPSETQEAMPIRGAKQKLSGQVGFLREDSSVPLEIQLRGPAMQQLYSQACRQGARPVHSTRGLVVGQYRAGKTCVVRRLTGEEVVEDEPITDGIEISPSVMTTTWRKTKEEPDEFKETMAERLAEQQERNKSKPLTLLRTQRAVEQQSDRKTPAEETRKRTPQTPQKEPLKEKTHTQSQQTEDLANKRREKGVSQQTRHQQRQHADVTTQRQTQDIPNDVIVKAKERLQGGITDEQIGTAEHPRLSIWDFGGQATYYGSHQCFYTYRGIYILVMSLLQKLSSPVPHQDYKASADNLVTGRDYLDHWLNSVHTHALVHGREHTGEPPVVLVLTNKDIVSKSDIENYKKEVLDHISGMAAGEHVLPKIFVIDNFSEDNSDIDELREYLREVAKSQWYMGQEVPITWLHLKSKLMDKRREGDPFCPFQDVVDLARSDDVGIMDDSHVADILTFLHDVGDIIFINEPTLRDHVALRPQVMIDVFKTIITVPEYQQDRSMGGEVAEMWRRLENEGILSDRLLTIIWTKADQKMQNQKMQKPFLIQNKTFLKRLMEKYYLICNATSIDRVDNIVYEAEKEEIYFVPSLLASKPDDETLSSEFEDQSVFTEGLPVRKFLSSCLFEIKEKWIPSIQYDWCFEEESDEGVAATPSFHPLSDIGQETATGSSRFPEDFVDVWMGGAGDKRTSCAENSGGDGPVMIESNMSPDGISAVRTIGPVLDCMETCGGLSLTECDRIRHELTSVSRFKKLLAAVYSAGDMCRRLLGASVEVCLPERAPMFLREERGNEVVILHVGDYNDKLARPLLAKVVQSSSRYGVTVCEDAIEPGDVITDKILNHLLKRNVRMVVPIITPQALHSRYWSTLGYEFSIQNKNLVFPVFAYPEGTRERLLEVLHRRCAGMLDMSSAEVPITEGRLSSTKTSLTAAEVMRKASSSVVLNTYKIKPEGCTIEEDGVTLVFPEGCVKKERSLSLEVEMLPIDDALTKTFSAVTPVLTVHQDQEEDFLQTVRVSLPWAWKKKDCSTDKVVLRERKPNHPQWTVLRVEFQETEDAVTFTTRHFCGMAGTKESGNDDESSTSTGEGAENQEEAANQEIVEESVTREQEYHNVAGSQQAVVESISKEPGNKVEAANQGKTEESITTKPGKPDEAANEAAEAESISIKPGHQDEAAKQGVADERESKVLSASTSEGATEAFHACWNRYTEDKVYLIINPNQATANNNYIHLMCVHKDDDCTDFFQAANMQRRPPFQQRVTMGKKEMIDAKFDDKKEVIGDPHDVSEGINFYFPPADCNRSSVGLVLNPQIRSEPKDTYSGSVHFTRLSESGTQIPVTNPRDRISSAPVYLSSAHEDGKKTTKRRHGSQLSDSGPSAKRTKQVDVSKYFDKVVDDVSSDWDNLARKLNFSENQIDGIRRKKDDEERRCREMLRKWKNREGKAATLQALKKALIKIEQRDVAERLEDSSDSSESSDN
ncbi:uncharacterized protein LOC144887686 [Branchiostoma floridae x Branchiostoma japonicum]